MSALDTAVTARSPRPTRGVGRAAPAGREAGAGTVVLLAVLAVAVVLALTLTALAQAASASTRASTAADAAALAAAQGVGQGSTDDPCRLAVEVAEANGAHLVECRPDPDTSVTVAVEVSPRGAAGALGPARGRARAGPDQLLGHPASVDDLGGTSGLRGVSDLGDLVALSGGAGDGPSRSSAEVAAGPVVTGPGP